MATATDLLRTAADTLRVEMGRISAALATIEQAIATLDPGEFAISADVLMPVEAPPLPPSKAVLRDVSKAIAKVSTGDGGSNAKREAQLARAAQMVACRKCGKEVSLAGRGPHERTCQGAPSTPPGGVSKVLACRECDFECEVASSTLLNAHTLKAHGRKPTLDERTPTPPAT